MDPATGRRPRPRLTWLAAPVALSIALTSCSADPPTRSGAEERSRTLTAATYFPPGYPSGDQLAHLAATLEAGGPLRITTQSVTQTADEDPGSTVLAMVRAGDLDIAIVPTRVFDLVGVTSFQGLQAPLHFISVEQADAVVTDPVADTMMQPATSLGLTPLALTFDALRNVKGYRGALTKPEDFAGHAIAARPSAATDRTLTALGATTYRAVGAAFEKDVQDGKVVGLEDSINQSNLQGAGTSVGNEFLSFKANAIVVNTSVWNGLTAAQQSRLRDAAQSTRTFSTTDMAQHMDIAAAAAAYCASGSGDVVVASDDDVAAMRAAVEPVITWMRRDELTARVIDRVDALGAARPPVNKVTPCRASVAPHTQYTPVEPMGDQGAIDGTWRHVVTADTLLAAGVSRTEASNNVGVWTWTFEHGQVTATKEGQAPCSAEVRIRGDRASFIWDEATGCSDDFTMRFRTTGDTLTLDQATGPTPDIPNFSNAFFSTGLSRLAN